VFNTQWFLAELLLGLLALILLISADPLMTVVVFTPMLVVIFSPNWRKPAFSGTEKLPGRRRAR